MKLTGPDLLNLARLKELFPGIAVSLVAGISATYLAQQYAAPVMLFALLIGMALNFLNEQTQCCAGINFTASTVLRIGVALLGLRITLDQVLSVGAANLAMVSAAIAITMTAGMFIALKMNRSREFGLLSGGSVSICGASAAMAIATVLPNHPDREKQLVFTILVVTTLSTLAMILYPVLAARLGLSEVAAGYFLGGSIHDVAQVVGAGYSMSTATGDFATITKPETRSETRPEKR